MIDFSRALPGFSGLRSQRLRVGFDARSLCGHRTGVGTYAANLIGALLEADPRIFPILFSTETPPAFPGFRDGQVGIVARPGIKANNFLWTNISLRRAIGEKGIDLFHSPGYTKPLRLGIPSIVTLHDVSYAAAPQWYPYSSGFLRQAWYRKSALSADAILTDSDFSRREIIRVYEVSPDRVYTICLGVDHRRFLRIDAPQSVSALLARHDIEPGFLLFVGDVHPRRNIARVIEALHQVKAASASLRNLELVVIGRVLDPAKTAPRPDVRYLGYVPDSDLPLFYNAARAFVYPSFYEGFGFPVLEAMACGCPVIVSRGTACDEVAGVAGLKVDPTSVQSIAEALTAVIENRDVAGRSVEAGLARAAEFQWRKTAEQTLEVYFSVIKARSSDF